MKLKNTIKDINNNDDGYSLVEFLVAILLLTIIVGAFLTGFEVSTRANITSGKIVDEGYVAQTCMEDIIGLSYNVSTIEELANEVKATYNEPLTGTTYDFRKEIEDYHVEIKLSEVTETLDSGEIIVYTKVLVKVYEDDSYSNPVASLQNIITL